MGKKERKLTPAEQKRKTDFERICKELERSGYEKKDLTVGIFQANMMVILMLPFAAAAFGLYRVLHPISRADGSFSFYELLAFLIALLLFTLLHEVLHGLTWGIFAKGHRNAIAFGIIWKMLTPYCTCVEPLTKWQYAAGAAMPTLVLGFAPAVIAAVVGNFWLLVLSSILILSGSGDFSILLKMFQHSPSHKEDLYCDHPYECGVVVFEKK